MSLIAVALIVLGLFFLVVGSIGMLRLPDVFSRAHALSLTDSVGAFLVLAGLAAYQGLSMNLLRILVVLMLIYMLNPVIAHATVRAAHRAGVEPSKPSGPSKPSMTSMPSMPSMPSMKAEP